MFRPYRTSLVVNNLVARHLFQFLQMKGIKYTVVVFLMLCSSSAFTSTMVLAPPFDYQSEEVCLFVLWCILTTVKGLALWEVDKARSALWSDNSGALDLPVPDDSLMALAEFIKL